jgi:group I intron endonuclease
MFKEPEALCDDVSEVEAQGERKKPCCLYIGTCLINGKMYAGVSVNPEGRWKDHRKMADPLHKKNVKRQRIHHAIAKHGIENFTFEIMGWWDSEPEAKEAEQDVIAGMDLRRSGYNDTDGGDGCRLSPEQYKARGRASAAAQRGKKLSLEHRKAIGDAKRGKKKSLEHRKAIGDAKRGKKKSLEHRKALGDAKRGKKQSPEARKAVAEGLRAAFAARRALRPGAQERHEARKLKEADYLRRKALGLVRPYKRKQKNS